MNKVDRLRELHAIFAQGKGGIGIFELCEVMEALPELLDLADASEDYFTNIADGKTAENYMRHFAFRRALAPLYVHAKAESEEPK